MKQIDAELEIVVIVQSNFKALLEVMVQSIDLSHFHKGGT